MGAHYRRKYTILRHWLIHQSKTGFVRLKVAEESPILILALPVLSSFDERTR